MPEVTPRQVLDFENGRTEGHLPPVEALAERLAADHAAETESGAAFPCCKGLDDEQKAWLAENYETDWLRDVTLGAFVSFELLAQARETSAMTFTTPRALFDHWLVGFQRRLVDRRYGRTALIGSTAPRLRARPGRLFLRTCFLAGFSIVVQNEVARAHLRPYSADVLRERSAILADPLWDAFFSYAASWARAPLMKEDQRGYVASLFSDAVTSQFLADVPLAAQGAKEFLATAFRSARLPFTPLRLSDALRVAIEIATKDPVDDGRQDLFEERPGP